MSQPWLFTSPASRGIGLALTRHLLRTTRAPIVCTARKGLDAVRSQILEGLQKDDVKDNELLGMEERLQVLELDVLDESSISAAAASCASRFPAKSHHLHLAFCVPGILHPEKSPAQIDAVDALSTFQVNTLGPMLLAKHFLPFFPRKATRLPDSAAEALGGLPVVATMALMSARVGSISDNKKGGWYSYRASKAAVNQLVKSLDIYVRNTSGEKAMVLGLHPGTVKTGLSEEFWDSVGEKGLLEPEDSARHLCEVVAARGQKGDGRGRCWDWKNTEIMP